MNPLRLLVVVAAAAAVAVLSATAQQRALVSVSVASLRSEPRHSAEMVSQAVMGTPVEIVSHGDGWAFITTPEGYKGYVKDNSLAEVDSAAFDAWTRSPRVVVRGADQQWVDATTGEQRVTDVVSGCILQATGRNTQGDSLYVYLPDGRKGRIAVSGVMDLQQWAHQTPDYQSLGRFAQRLMGIPYLWGGTSTKGMDCSGLTKMAWYEQGVILPRDASQQAKIGEKVWERPTSRGNLQITPRTVRDAIAQAVSSGDLHPGDLLFFGNPATGRVNHVGIYIGNGRMVHCAGRVRVNSIIPETPSAHPAHLLQARRLTPEDLPSLSARNHPLYFPQEREPLYRVENE